MLETELRELFERQAADSPAASRISIEAASRIGRTRLRRRRASSLGTPLLAAGAVLAVVLIAAVPTRHLGTGHSPRPSATKSTAPTSAAPRQFNPLRPYAAFGWLPAGALPTAPGSSGTVEYLGAVGKGQLTWRLAIFAAGQCSLAHARLTCGDLTSLQDPLVTSRAPDIDGHSAYWGQDVLVFQYASGGWATVIFHQQADVLRIAEHLAFGAASVPVRFPAQLTGLSADWVVSYVLSIPGKDGSVAFQYVFARGAASLRHPNAISAVDVPYLTVQRANPNLRCYSNPGYSTQKVIAGHQVTVTRIPARHEPAEQQICAADAGGLWVSVLIAGSHPAIDVTDVFAHLRLLGPDPAHWTTQPVRR
jgi:hypothetical protein